MLKNRRQSDVLLILGSYLPLQGKDNE